jgi:hypothetical protein
LTPSRTIQSPPAVDAFSLDPSFGRARAKDADEIEEAETEEERTYALVIKGRSYP